MTERASNRRPRKRLLLIGILSAFMLAAAWVTYFLATFDINNYRQQAEANLSSLLSLPVKIGDIHYNFHDTNLALHITDLQIGDDQSALRFEAPKTLINLKWWGLLERDFRFSKISLVQPQILLKQGLEVRPAGGSAGPEPTPLMIDLSLLYKVSINSLEIIDGSILIEDNRPDSATQQVAVTALDGELADIGLGRVSPFTLKGDLEVSGQKEKSAWQLLGENTLELDESAGLILRYNFDLVAKALDLSSIRTTFSKKFGIYAITGKSDLSLHGESSAPGSIDFHASLSSKDLQLLLSSDQKRQANFKSLLFSGRLQTRGEHPGLENLSLKVDESYLTGSINWAAQGQPFLTTVSLHDSSLEVSQIKQWLPIHKRPWQTIGQNLKDQGSVKLDIVQIACYEDRQSLKTWRLEKLKGELQKLAWAAGQGPAPEIIVLPFDIDGSLWQIDNGRGKLGSVFADVKGSGKYQGSSITLKSLNFSAELQPDQLFADWRIAKPALSTNGKVAVSGQLTGQLEQLNMDLQADLSQFSITHPSGLKLLPAPGDILTLHGTLSPTKINLDHGALKWSIAKGHLSGSYQVQSPESLAIDALLNIDDLSKLAATLPLLEKLQLHGQADLSISQRGLPTDISPELVLTLREAGLHATRHIADLSHINGRARLTTTGLTADNLRVHLGESPLTVQAKLEDFANPNLVLNVKAPSVRADELVFKSDKAMLRDIAGHLEIDRNGLTFAPVNVRLDGGTKASVRGTISFAPPVDVRLDITSEFARIKEVIGLWTDRSGLARKKTPSSEDPAAETKPGATITINAQVEHGELYGMNFHHATGVIVPTRQRLSIHPLDFSVGEGYCNAQVLIDFKTEAPSMMRISGHAEDVDALEVYRELLNQKSIVRGKLRGDFYLTGEIGANYLPSSYGNFSIQIKDGVLHQFSVLSKIFSLLNVSQIFAFELPDMDKEGMPFNNLSANFQLDQGILKSEDLKIQSEAMNQSYIGQMNLVSKDIDLAVAIHPLGTVDKVVSSIPVAGWLLTGEDKALLTAYFKVTGKASDTEVETLPLSTLSGPTIGLLKRTLTLPFKLFEDPQILWGGDGSGK